MRQTERGWKSCLMLPLLGAIMFILGGLSPVRAEPSAHISPGDLISNLLSSTVGALSPSSAPLKVLAKCSHELEQCWVAHGRNKANREQVADTCWKETKRCPKVCKDEYFSRRKAGMSALKAEPLFYGRHEEDSSCVPGVDTLTNADQTVKRNNSILQLTVMLGGKPVKARIRLLPLDALGRTHPTTADPGYFKRYQPSTTGRMKPLKIHVHAGRYWLSVTPPYYTPDKHNYAFSRKTETIIIKDGQTLKRNFDFAAGHLIVIARDERGKLVDTRLKISQPRKNYLEYRSPLNMPVGRYRVIVYPHTKGRKSKAFDVDIRQGQTVSKTIFFSAVGTIVVTPAQRNMPDLVVKVVDAGKGTVGILNIGNGKAKTSDLSVVCSTFRSSKHVRHCAKGLHLPNYHAKHNTLVYPIPALSPGASYTVQLFGPGALPRQPGVYGMKLLIDLSRQITESNESNNYSRLDMVIEATPKDGDHN